MTLARHAPALALLAALTVLAVLLLREGHRDHTRPGHGQQRPHSARVGTAQQDTDAIEGTGPMSLRRQDCYVVTCDVCRTEYVDPETEGPVWFADETTAEQTIRNDRWMVLARHLPDRLICPADDDAHRAHVDMLLPPEPVMQIPGQLGLDGTEEPTR